MAAAAWSEEAQAAVLPLVADIRLDERVGDAGLHGVQGALKVSRLDLLGFDVVLQGQEGGLAAHRRYLGQETDTEVQPSVRRTPRRRESAGPVDLGDTDC